MRTKMAMDDRILADAFHQTLKDVYFTAKLSHRTLRRAARRARSTALRRAFEYQGEETADRVARLGRVFEIIGKSARARTCAPIKGLTATMEAYLDEAGSTAATDAVLISWAQEIDQYTIGRCGTLKDWSCKLGIAAAEDVIEETLQEASRAAAELSRVVDDIASPEMGMAATVDSPARFGDAGAWRH
jgi:ferritin-like metal-binding protein YciE